MSRLHTHLCDRCRKPFACGGELIRNFDGLPETICSDFTVDGQKHPALRQCEACAMTAYCADCDKRPAKVEIDGDKLCETCADERKAAEARLIADVPASAVKAWVRR